MPYAGSTLPPAQKPAVAAPARNMRLAENDTENPVARLQELANETPELVKQANASMCQLRKQLRTVKTHFRDHERQIGSSERQMEKSRGLIQRLQEAIAA